MNKERKNYEKKNRTERTQRKKKAAWGVLHKHAPLDAKKKIEGPIH